MLLCIGLLLVVIIIETCFQYLLMSALLIHVLYICLIFHEICFQCLLRFVPLILVSMGVCALMLVTRIDVNGDQAIKEGAVRQVKLSTSTSTFKKTSRFWYLKAVRRHFNHYFIYGTFYERVHKLNCVRILISLNDINLKQFTLRMNFGFVIYLSLILSINLYVLYNKSLLKHSKKIKTIIITQSLIAVFINLLRFMNIFVQRLMIAGERVSLTLAM